MAERGSRHRGRTGWAGLPSLLLASLVLASCAGGSAGSSGAESGRCVFRYATDNSKGGQMRWGPCNNHDPMMTPIFEPSSGADAN